ncbi:MAG: APC family permease [Nitrososphaerota archaeon]|nr:APC family permease [Nitrososphaerota archaeon]
MADSKTNMFVRDSTGLVKNVSALDAVALNVSNMSAGAALATIGFTTVLPVILGGSFLGFFDGANLVYGSIIAFVLAIPQVVVYTMMSRRVSRTGGDYVWVSRAFGGFLGGPLSFMGYTIETTAYLALIALSAVFAIGSVGVTLGYMNFLGLALPGNIPGADVVSQFVVAAVIFAILIGINLLKPKLGYKLVSVFMTVGVLVLILAIFTILSAGRAGAEGYAGSIASFANDSSLTYTSMVNSYTGPAFSFSNTLLLLPFFALFVYPWINAGPAVASELKGKTALRWNIPIAITVVFVLVTSAFASMYYAGGTRFVNAALANPTYVYDYAFNFWTMAMGVTTNTALQWIIGIGWIVWELAILAYGIIVLSRYVFAQAFDRFLPAKFADVHQRFGSPWVALLFGLVLVTFLIAGASFVYGSFVSLYGAVVASMIYFIFVGLSAVIYASRNEKGGTKRLLSLAGILQVLVFLYLTYQFLYYSTIWGGNPLAYGWVVGSFVIGIILYAASKAYHAKRGINIDMTYKEIPPD